MRAEWSLQMLWEAVEPERCKQSRKIVEQKHIAGENKGRFIVSVKSKRAKKQS